MKPRQPGAPAGSGAPAPDPDESADAIRQAAHRAGFERLTANADQAAAFPWPIWEALVELGVQGLEFPPSDGGLGAPVTTTCRVVAELGRHSIAASTGFFTFAGFGTHLRAALTTGHPLRPLLAGIADGSVRTALSLTEPSGGSDLSGMRTRLRRDGASWRLRGAKLYTTLAAECTHLIVGALTDGDGRWSDRFAFAVLPNRATGVTMSRIQTQALRSCPTFEVAYDDVAVPAEAVIEPPLAIQALRSVLNTERLAVASQSYGLGLRALAVAREQASLRELGGGRLIDKQVIRHALVDRWQALAASWALIERAAGEIDAGARQAADGVLPTMAQRLAAEAAHGAADLAVQVCGGMGLTADSPAQRLWRDTRLHLIGPIAAEASADYLGRALLRADLG